MVIPYERGEKRFTEEEVWISHGDRKVFGMMYVPEMEGACRAVIMSHGYNGCHKDFQEEGKYFASHGILALAIDFCGGSKASRSSGDSRDMTVFTEKEDLLAVFDVVKSRKEIREDDIVPLSYQLRAQQVYENAQLTIWPREGHGFTKKRQAEAASLALYFMES